MLFYIIGNSLATVCTGLPCVSPTSLTPTPTPTTAYVPAGSINISSPFQAGYLQILQTISQRASLIFLFLIGVVLLVLIIYGGALYIVDAGSEENAKKARKIITSAVIGLVIISFVGIIMHYLEVILGINLLFI